MVFGFLFVVVQVSPTVRVACEPRYSLEGRTVRIPILRIETVVADKIAVRLNLTSRIHTSTFRRIIDPRERALRSGVDFDFLAVAGDLTCVGPWQSNGHRNAKRSGE